MDSLLNVRIGYLIFMRSIFMESIPDKTFSLLNFLERGILTRVSDCRFNGVMKGNIRRDEIILDVSIKLAGFNIRLQNESLEESKENKIIPS